MTSTIVVITGERSWTLRAVHLAAAMAREAGLPVVLLRLVRVAHLEYLGSGAREALLPYDEFDALNEYLLTAEAYGVPAGVELFEYTDYNGGIASAADQRAAAAVFAPAPAAGFASLARLRLWALRRTLRRPLYTLGHGDAPMAWMEAAPETNTTPAGQPSVSMRNL